MAQRTVRILILSAMAALLAGVLGCAGGTDTVRLATTDDYYPFSFINEESGEVDGLERELGDELCSRADLDCEWVLNDWDSLIPNLEAGEFDAIIAGMSITDERDERIDFTQPYYPPTPSVYLALSGAGDEAVQGRLGANANTIYSDYFTEQGIPFRPFEADSDDHIQALLAGEIDATLVDHGFAVTALGEYEGGLAIVGPSILLDKGLGIGVREDDDLRGALNSALTSMKDDGSLNAIITRWVGDDAATFN